MTRLPELGPRGEGWVAIQGLIFVAIAAAGFLLPGSGAGLLREALPIVGVVAIAAGGAFAGWAVGLLRSSRALSALPHPTPEAELVDRGPYRLVRHPIYAGLVLGALGWAAVRSSLPTLVAAFVLLLFFDLKRRREEAWLRERIPGYEAYAKRTAALLPGLY